MPESFSEIKPLLGLAIQFDGLPLSEGRRADPDIHDNVEDLSLEALNVFSLTGRDICEVNSADRSLPGDADVHLFKCEFAPRRLDKKVSLEGLKKDPSTVRPENRSEEPCSVDRGRS